MSDNDSLCSLDSLDSIDSGKVVNYNKKVRNNKIKAPIYDGTVSLSDYVRKIEQFKRDVNREKYNLILQFINDWFGHDKHNKLDTLIDFKNISEDTLFNKRKPNHNRKIIKKYYNKIIVICALDKEKITNDSEQISDIMSILKDSLKSIDYKLCFRYKNIELNKKVKMYYIKKI